MRSPTVLRNSPHFGRLFDAVHPFCWPILWWQLNHLFRMILADKSLDVLYSVNRWDFVTIRYIAKCEDLAPYKTPERTFRPLTDASWETDLPANRAAQCSAMLPCCAGEVARRAGGGLRFPVIRFLVGRDLCRHPTLAAHPAG